jgi:hypothetical protein
MSSSDQPGGIGDKERAMREEEEKIKAHEGAERSPEERNRMQDADPEADPGDLSDPNRPPAPGQGGRLSTG